MRRADDGRGGTPDRDRTERDRTGQELLEHLARSQHGIEARVLTARLFASMPIEDVYRCRLFSLRGLARIHRGLISWARS
jgi:hypothetical protein